MASNYVQPAEVQQDTALMKQIEATHSSDGSQVDVKPILKVVEDILLHAAPGIESVINGTRENADELVDMTSVAEFDGILEALACVINKISCELSCKCSGGVDAHTTTMAIFNMLSNYSWEAKVVISLAAFAVNYGDFWLVAQLFNTNPLAKSVSLLKQLPDVIEHAVSLKSLFDAINTLIKAVLDVTKCVVDLKELSTQYISQETESTSTAMALIRIAAYWTIRSMVACASMVTSLLCMSYKHLPSPTETWEWLILGQQVGNINGQLFEKRQAAIYEMLVSLFKMDHPDNMRILKALIYSKDDILPLVDGSTNKTVNIDVLKRKTVLLLISDLDMFTEEVDILAQIYKKRTELNYEIVWLPIVDRSTPWNEENQHKFQQLQLRMPWYTVVKYSLLEPAIIRYIKEVWKFEKKLMLVVLDPQGKVVCLNARHMILIWGNLAYPFTSTRETLLWKENTWSLELLVDDIDSNIPKWIREGKYICLYGGADIEWIRKFTATAKAVARTTGIALEMVYVGNRTGKQVTRNITETINAEKLSSCWRDDFSIWFFWTRLEIMFFSLIDPEKAVENDSIRNEVSSTDPENDAKNNSIFNEVDTVLGFDSSHKEWAIISKAPAEMTRADGETVLKSFYEFNTWEEDARERGFIPALSSKFKQLQTPHHCNKLILPWTNGSVPEKVVCRQCGRPMENYLMFSCCTDEKMQPSQL
ncbi:sieve element occlusion amino-terminus protein [Actinidia rufa]|uniref:Sieve element occlusion amino-terminus protein n=1 Tax=Actinidia rufa TaxID=165716 RepID=A0A7J0FZ63_9ERIC|nr:sieve element occlusion amino-terminus protein [Actinidia rufa]